jgi:hypothetical protein
MLKKQIFIGSPSESRQLAEVIARKLSEIGFVSRRYWTEFPPGSVTIDRLREIASQVDAAVLIGTGVDVTQSRSVETASPRDNVILEYGLFVGVLGRERCYLLMDSNAKLPSDVFGITNVRISDDQHGVATEVAEHFAKFFSLPRQLVPESTPVVADPEMIEVSLREGSDPHPREWHQRQLYYGPEGAMNWLKLCSSDSYLGKAFYRWEREASHELARSARPHTYVSLGPGDGTFDLSMMKLLVAEDRGSQYIPVDISEPLLHRVASKVSKYAATPVGIFGDYEEGLSFIHKQLGRYAKSPILYGLIGGSLGNFDESDEGDFLHTLRAMMGAQDRLMIHVSLHGKKWSKETDPRCQLSKLSPEFRRFVSAGVARRFNLPVEDCVREFAKKAKLNVLEQPETDPTSHKVIEYIWHEGENSWMCTRITRYNLDRLRGVLTASGFQVDGDFKLFVPSNDCSVNHALVLLKSKSSQ